MSALRMEKYLAESSTSLTKSTLASRGATAFDIFWRGVLPVEIEPGESCEIRRRISRSAIFDMV